MHLVTKSEENANLIAGKEIYLLLGGTGAGKSTTVQYLIGSKMGSKKYITPSGDQLEYIGVIEYNKDCNMDDMKEIKMSPASKSCTTYIKTIKFTWDDEEFIICDSPGLEDTRGSELDIANIHGVIYAAKKCKAITPVIIISQKGLEERMIGLKKIA